MNYLSGKKTYIVAALGAITFACAALGYIGQDIANQIYTMLGIAGTFTMRAAIAKAQA